LRLLSSPDRDGAVAPRIDWYSGRISARAIGMIAEAALNPHGGYERPRRFRASLPRGHQSQGRRAQAGYLMACNSARWMRPADMTHSLASWSLRAAQLLLSFQKSTA
jgi:hypothetical protein